jgi:hypothetical protein
MSWRSRPHGESHKGEVSKMKKKDAGMVSQLLMAASVVAVVLSAFSYMTTDIWLASSQWLMVAAVLALYGTYLKV